MACSLEIEIDRSPFLTRAESLDLKDTRTSGTERYPEGAEPDGTRRQPLYRPGEGQGTEPASNRSVSTLAVHAATAYAKERSLDGQFFRAASKEYWEHGVDLGSLYTLRRISMSVGLDWGDMWPELDSGSYRNSVLVQHRAAIEAGVVRTPSFEIGGRLHSGNLSFEEMRAALQAAG
ncbi:MAG: DsbA family protein [Dehalococcoidia bacterium]